MNDVDSRGLTDRLRGESMSKTQDTYSLPFKINILFDLYTKIKYLLKFLKFNNKIKLNNVYFLYLFNIIITYIF